ncbi:DUF3810 domain-containing protein [Robiginitalea sp.]|uniref:DUF3810 domain-containing protein n=1 Tax=Robiginitalea sp. TaxID=1902411 RepID=UPI003C7338F5
MHSHFKTGIVLSFPLQLIAVNWMAGHPQWVEKYYSTGIYPLISAFFRRLYGWVPFSVGDLIYFFLIVLSIGYLIQKRHWIRHHPWTFLGDCFAALSVLHFTFYLLWGSNYFRQPLAQTLGYEVKYTTAELVELTGLLVRQTNDLQRQLSGDSLTAVHFPGTRDINLEKTLVGYQELAKDFPILSYDPPSLKPSLFSTLLSYMGYGGYLNPFTGEAQVNHKLPLFRHSVVCGHEVGHQLGYSAENETNFIGYLVTLRNPDKSFQYSASAYGLSYCLSEVRRRDKGVYEKLLKDIHPGVRANYRELTIFWKDFENPMEPIFKSIFNRYLEINKQKDGIRSYNRVVALIVGYHRIYPVTP